MVLAAAALLLGGTTLHFVAGFYGGRDTSEHAWGADDAYITYRYADNLLHGHGLVFNPGERVEGFTNLLFVGISALTLGVFGKAWAYPAVTALNLVFAALAFLVFHRRAAEHLGPRRAALASLLFAGCPSWWLWTASGMETSLVVLLQLALWSAVDREQAEGGNCPVWPLALAATLLILARADGFVWVAAAAAYFLLQGNRRSALRTLGVAAPSFVALFAWRLAYYGELLPNTYYAKVSDPFPARIAAASRRLVELALEVGLLPYLLTFVVVAAALVSGRKSWSRRLRWPFPVFFAAAVTGFWIVVGGDHYAERFLLILFPLGIVELLRLFDGAGARSSAVLVLLLLSLQCRPLLFDPRFDYVAGRYDCWVTLGEFLAEVPGDPLLAVDAAGKIPFFSGLRTIDMRGLTDPHIARIESRVMDSPGHNKRAPEYVLDRRPELIAAWVLPQLDLAVGLQRPLYSQAGYRLAWMLNTARVSRRWDVLDVRGASDDDIRNLVAAGYRYGVLEHRADGDPGEKLPRGSHPAASGL